MVAHELSDENKRNKLVHTVSGDDVFVQYLLHAL